jgi:hypothetical protein
MLYLKPSWQSGALDDIPLLFGDEPKRVNLKVPIVFIIGDMQGGDLLHDLSSCQQIKLTLL